MMEYMKSQFDREVKIKKPVPKEKRPMKTRHLIEDAINNFGEDLIFEDEETEDEDPDDVIGQAGDASAS